MSYTLNKQYQKSVLNAYTNQNQTLTTGQSLIFNNINLLNGCSIDFIAGSGSIELEKSGVYLVTVDAIAVESGTVGDVTIQLQKNGVNVNGATASENSTADTDIVNLSFSTLVRVLPSCASIDNTTVLTILNTGVGATFSNVNINIIKLC